jgi:hypothetical protein
LLILQSEINKIGALKKYSSAAQAAKGLFGLPRSFYLTPE